MCPKPERGQEKRLGSLWEQVARALQDRVTEAVFRLWVAPIQAQEIPSPEIPSPEVPLKEAPANGQAPRLVLGCPNRFFAGWVREHYLRLIEEELRRLCPGPVEVTVVVSPPKAAEPEAEEAEESQLGLPEVIPAGRPLVRLSGLFTFEEFVVGECNSFAFQAAQALADGTSGLINSIYLLSGAGLGKSHLAQAIGHRVLQARPRAQVVYATAEDFTNEMVTSIRTGRTQQFKEKWRRGCDLLLLEGVQFLAGKEKTQAELAYTLDTLCREGKRVIFTGSCPPRQIPRLGEGLRSRLNAALITSIGAPDLDTRGKILRQKAARRGLRLSAEVCRHLAENLTGDVRQLEGAVMGLAAKASLMGRPVDLALAGEVLGDILGVGPEITVERVQEVVGQYYRVSREELASRSRKRQIAQPRNLAMYLCRQHTRAPLEAIGRAFGRNHATVLYAVQAVERELRKKGPLHLQAEFVANRLLGKGESEG